MISISWKYVIPFIVFWIIIAQNFYLERKNTSLNEEVKEYKLRLKIAEENARKQSEELSGEIWRIKENAEKEILQHNQEIDNLQRVITTSSRLHKCPTAGGKNVPGNTRTPNRENDAGFSEADARNLAGIAVKGDEAIRKLNACIDAYNAVRVKINGTPAPASKE